MALSVLVVSSDIEARRSLTRALESQECDCVCAPSIKEAMELLRRGAGPFGGGSTAQAAGQPVRLVFCDREVQDGNYRDFLIAVRNFRSQTRVVITSRLADWDEYLDAMRLGAFDVIAAPCRAADVEWTLLQARRDLRECAVLAASQHAQQRAATAD